MALAPDLDARFERLYGYLHDDVTRRRASIGLALELAGALPASPALAAPADARARRSSTGGLVVVEEPERPFLTRSLRVPDRVAMHLLGDDRSRRRARRPRRRVAAACHGAEPDGARARAPQRRDARLPARARRRRRGARSPPAAFALLGKRDASRSTCRGSPRPTRPRRRRCAAVREARLAGAGLVAGPVEALVDAGRAARSARSPRQTGPWSSRARARGTRPGRGRCRCSSSSSRRRVADREAHVARRR